MYINFQQNQVKTQVMTVPTRLSNYHRKKLLTQTDGTTDRRTDGHTNVHVQTDTHRRTNRRTDGRTDIASDNIRYFFQKRKNC